MILKTKAIGAADDATAFSVTWVLDDRDPNSCGPGYLDSTVGFTGRERVDEAAALIVARTDTLVEKINAETSK